MPETGFGPEEFAVKAGVSRETLSRLKAYADLLADWNARHNLVAKSTLPDLWHRHLWDSAQLAAMIPFEAHILADLGSGAGFPGLVLAVMRPDLAVTLHEATTKKCAFLTAAAERMALSVTVENARMVFAWSATAGRFSMIVSWSGRCVVGMYDHAMSRLSLKRS